MSYSEFKQVEQNWSAVTQRANMLYQENSYQSAIADYKQALFYSELMLRDAEQAQSLNIQIASPFFVSCLNIANNFWAMEDLKSAGDYFLYNVWHLKMLTKKENISPELHFEAIKNWEKSVLCLVDFYDKTGQDLNVDFMDDSTYDQIANTRKYIVNSKINLN